MTFSRKIQIDVCLPGQHSSFITLKVFWTHVRMEVAPVVVGDGRVVIDARFVEGVVVVTRV